MVEHPHLYLQLYGHRNPKGEKVLCTVVITRKTKGGLVVGWILSDRGRDLAKNIILMTCIEVFHVNRCCWKSSRSRGKQGTTAILSNLNSIGDKDAHNGRESQLLRLCQCQHKRRNEEVYVHFRK